MIDVVGHMIYLSLSDWLTDNSHLMDLPTFHLRDTLIVAKMNTTPQESQFIIRVIYQTIWTQNLAGSLPVDFHEMYTLFLKFFSK